MATATKTTFTPGPWEVNCDHFIEAGNGTLICDPHIEPDGDPPELEANARLIAAAPDLLAACERALGLAAIERSQPEAWRDDDSTTLEMLRAAIAKAIGSTP